MATTASETKVQELYIAYFGRPADPAGLAFYADALDAASTTVEAIATSFAASTEAATIVALDTDAYLSAVYLQAFGRAYVEGTDGTFWKDAINNAATTKELAMVQILEGASGTDTTAVANKVTVAKTYTAAVTADSKDYSSTADAAAAKAVLDAVTEDAATVTSGNTAAQTAVDGLTTVSSNPGQAFALTTDADTIVGTTGDDTITSAAGTLGTDDVIIDQTSTDNDTFSATLTATNAVTTISGIENVNFDWNAFGTATIDADDISGATITVTSSKTGFLGNTTVSNAGANTIVAGAGADGTLTVTGATTSVVTGGVATAVSVTAAGTASADDTLTLTAGSAATSVTVADFDSATVDAGTAATISVTDDDAAADDSDTLALTVGADTTITNNVDDLTVTASVADLTVTIDVVDASLDFAGDKNVTLNIDDATDLTTETVTNSSTGTLALTIDDIDGAADLDEVAADSITIAAATAGGALTVRSGTSVTASATLASAFGLTVAGTGTADTATLTLDDDQTQIITLAGIETTTVAANATVSGAAVDLTIAEINAGTNNVVLTGANDVTVSLAEAGDVDASALTNDLIITQDAAADMDISGSTTTNTVTFKGTTHDNNYVGQTGDDSVTFATTTGSAVAVVGSGDNTITANSLTTGDLVVNSGSGVDTISTTALTTGNVTLELGDGNNVVTLDGTFNGVNVTVVTGSGDDSVTINDATVAGDTVNLTLGAGTDSLVLSEDFTAGTITITGLSTIDVGGNSGAAIVNAALVTGQTYTLKSDGTNTAGIFTNELLVEMDAAGTVDLSGLVLDNTLTDGIGGVNVTGHAGNDTITGTDGNDIIATNGGTDTVTGGLGADTYTGGGGVDTFVIASADTGITVATADVIDDTSFTTTTDKLSLGTAGSATNYAEVVAVDGDTLADTLVDVNAAMDGTVKYVLVGGLDTNFATGGADGADGALFIDADLDGTVDDMIIITGASNNATFEFGDIIA